jgi:hypothetical protein
MLLGLAAFGYYAGALALMAFSLGDRFPEGGPDGETPTLGARVEFLSRSPHYYLPAGFAAAVVVATALGCRAARRGGGWPHWPALVTGIGEAAFLTALIFAFLGMSSAMVVVVKLGSAVTPAYMGDGFAIRFATLTLGPALLLLSLAGATLVRSMARPAA